MNHLNLQEAKEVILHGKALTLSPEALSEVERCYQFLDQF